MTTDIQMVAVQDALPVEFLDYEEMAGVPTLRIRGKDFRSVVEVIVNGFPSPFFLVQSDTEMLAEVPPDQTGAAITRILVLSARFTATERSVLRLRLSRLSRGVSGMEKLTQKYVRTLLTTPGSNIFRKNDGGGLRLLVGATGSKYNNSQLTGGFAQSVDRTTSQIVASQPSTLPPDEKLAAADLIGANFDKNTGTLYGRVRLTSMAGRSGLVNVPTGG